MDAPLPEGHPELIRVLSPLGVVIVFGVNNFPFAFSVLGGDAASAMAAGCVVIAKAHPSHPQTSSRVYELAAKALQQEGFPAGVLSLIHGVNAGVVALASGLSDLLGAKPFVGKSIDDGGIYSAPAIIKTTVAQVSTQPDALAIECFGPTGLVITYSSITELLTLVGELEGALPGSIFSSNEDANAVDVYLVNPHFGWITRNHAISSTCFLSKPAQGI